MKLFKYFFYALLIVFVLFLGTGLIFPEVEYEAEVIVDATPQKCWDVFTDTTKMAGWVQNFESIQTIQQTPDQIGSKYLLRVIDGGQQYEMAETVISYDPMKNYSFELENDVLINTISYNFEPLQEGTRIYTTNKIHGKDILMRSIFPFMKSMFLHQTEVDLNKLKNLIEHS